MVKDILFPISPNWFLSQVFDCSPNGRFCAGSKNSLLLFSIDRDEDSTNVSIGDIQVINNAHSEKVTSVKFYPANALDLVQGSLVTASEDGFIKLWNLETETEVSYHQHHQGCRATCMDWSSVDPQVVASADETGSIVKWQIGKNATEKFRFGKLSILSLRCSPVRADVVAIGQRGGLISVVSLLQKGTILEKLRSHEHDVVSLSWKPPVEEESSGLLVSGSVDRIINVWNMTELKLHSSYKLPYSGTTRRPTRQERLFTVVSWLQDNKFVCSGISGDIYIFDAESENKEPCASLREGHLRYVYGMLVWKDLMCSISQDRQIIVWHIPSEQIKHILPTTSGTISCLANSPVDTGRVAIGSHEGTIKIWNMNASLKHTVASLWQGIKSRVTSMAWHPEKDSTIAFATDEGRIGLHDAFIVSKPPKLCEFSHKKTVYTLCWGPPVYKAGETAPESNCMLYSCGDGSIFCHDPKIFSSTPLNVADVIGDEGKHLFTDIVWKTGTQILAVGKDNGNVRVYSAPHMVLLADIIVSKQMIMKLAWHHDGSEDQKWWLAGSSNESQVYVYDMLEAVSKPEGDPPLVIVRPTKKLDHHTSRVTWVCWNPHANAQLATCSYDGSTIVWDAITGTPIVTHLETTGRLFACLWDPLDPDKIMSGGEEMCVYHWSITETKNRPPPQKKVRRDLKKGKKQFEDLLKSSAKANQEKPANGDDEENEPQFEGAKASALGLKKKRNLAYKSLFPVTAAFNTKGRGAWIEACYDMLDAKKNPEKENELGSGDKVHLGMFAGAEATKRALSAELEYHVKNEQWLEAATMAVWTGELATVLRQAAAKSALDDTILSFAPHVSLKLWKELCELYAQQLIRGQNFLKAANLYLMIHKIIPAINLLCENKLYREALAVASVRLPADDPKLKTMLSDYGAKSSVSGNLDVAALCFLGSGDTASALRCLTKRSDPGCMLLAAHVATIEGTPQEVATLVTKTLVEAELRQDKETVTKALQDFPNFKWFERIQSCHHVVTAMMEVWRMTKTKPQQPLLDFIWKEWKECEDIKELYQNIKDNFRIEQQHLNSSKQLVFAVSCELALCLCADDLAVAESHLEAGAKFCMQEGQEGTCTVFYNILFHKGSSDVSDLVPPRLRDEGLSEYYTSLRQTINTMSVKLSSGNDSTKMNGVSSDPQEQPKITLPEDEGRTEAVKTIVDRNGVEEVAEETTKEEQTTT